MGMNADRFVHYKTGYEQVDKEHWQLFVQMDDIIKDLRSHILIGVPEKIMRMVASLKDHVVTETNIMDKFGYPYKQEHFTAHGKMMHIIDGIALSVTREERVSDYRIAELEDLFVKHIDCHDMQLFEFVRKNTTQNSLTSASESVKIAS